MRLSARLPAVLLAVTAVACGGPPRPATPTARRGLDAAALPFRILRARGGQEVSEADALAELGRARAICIGERHSNPHHHWAQLHLIRRLVERGGPMALGLEMFQRPVQGVLDDYAAGRIDDEALVSRSGWATRWGYDYHLYQPILALARTRGLPLLALNAPQELVKRVARKGLDDLSPAERAALPELDLTDDTHRAFFQAAMQGHEMPADGFDRFYTAQVIWDETMADGAARWLAADPARRLVILAGEGHCHDSAIPARLRRRGIAPALSVLPVIDDGEGNVADHLASPENDFLFVMSRGEGTAHGQPTRGGHATAAPPAAPPAPRGEAYREAASRIIAGALKSTGAWAKLEHLTDRIGHRLSGSEGLERAVAWATATLQADGHENVRAEKVMVPHWVRGEEFAEILAPSRQSVRLLALGGSGATPKKGLVAEVVSVTTFEELEALGSKVAGKIVLFDHPMPPFDARGTHYGEAVVYRTQGPARAARLGAVAALVRSVTARSLRSPHTGATRFDPKDRKIPAAAVSTEDADLISRLLRAGELVKMKLVLTPRTLPDAPSANVVAELVGREKPDEIVLLGAHLDSWDVGQGAHDDAAGCAMMMGALTLLRELDLRPRRTIRVVLFTNEENGLAGARAYAEQHKDELSRHVAAIEADTGAFEPRGFDVGGKDPARLLPALRELAELLAPLEATAVAEGHAGADLTPLEPAGVPVLGLSMDASTYFDYHHSEADTLDKIEPEHISKNVAVLAVMAYALAEMPERLGQPAEPPKP